MNRKLEWLWLDGLDEEPTLGFADEWRGFAIDKREPADDVMIEQIADMLDQSAESQNAHNYAGQHQTLAQLLFPLLHIEDIRRVMLMLADKGGLHNLDRADYDAEWSLGSN